MVAGLARSFLAGEQEAEQVAARGSETLGRRWRWLDFLAQRYVDRFSGLTRPRQREVMQFLLRDRGFLRAWAKYSDSDGLRVVNRFAGNSVMQPAAAAEKWNVPAIESVGALADWLGASVGGLEWFADLKEDRAAGRNFEQVAALQLPGGCEAAGRIPAD